MVDPLNYFLFEPVLHDWCNKARGMYYPVCGMMHINRTLAVNRKSVAGFLSLSEWFFTICPTLYNRK